MSNSSEVSSSSGRSSSTNNDCAAAAAAAVVVVVAAAAAAVLVGAMCTLVISHTISGRNESSGSCGYSRHSNISQTTTCREGLSGERANDRASGSVDSVCVVKTMPPINNGVGRHIPSNSGYGIWQEGNLNGSAFWSLCVHSSTTTVAVEKGRHRWE